VFRFIFGYDPALTVGDVDVDEGKRLAVLERAVLGHVEAVAVIVSIISRSEGRSNLHARRERQVQADLPDAAVADVGVLSIGREGNA